MTMRSLASQAAQALAVLLIPALHAGAQTLSPTFTTLYNLTDIPAGRLAIGAGGVLYGTTGTEGSGVCCGTVFSLTPPAAAGGEWTEALLYRFLGTRNSGSGGPDDGMFPLGVAIGSGGILYGTTGEGGAGECLDAATPPNQVGCGTVFSLTPPATPGGAWTEAMLTDFDIDGPAPNSVVVGGGGVLYGTTTLYGNSKYGPSGDCGYVFSLAPPATPGGQWSFTRVYRFTNAVSACGSNSGVVIGGGGVLYGAEFSDGGSDIGMVFSLALPAAVGQPWSENVLCNFPVALSVAAGGDGVLYGTAASAAAYDGTQPVNAIVFSLTPPAKAGGAWTEATLYSFTASDGCPVGDLTMGSGGVLYGVTGSCTGPTSTGGELFSLTPPATAGGAWTKATLHNFTGGSDGGAPNGFLVIGSDGTLYGTTQSGGSGGDGTVFSLKLAVPQPSINPGRLVTAARYTAPVAPGSIASVFGDFFVSPLSATQSPLPASLSGLSLQFNFGPPAPLFFVSGGQVNFQVPWELAFQSQVNLAATLNGQTGAAQTVHLAPYAPAIFTMNAQGSGQGAILDASNHLVDSSDPATPGSTVLQIFCTGLGPVSNQPPTGSPAPLSPLAYTSIIPTVTIGGVPADVSFSGLAPGYVGLYQVNAQVPAGLAAGNAVPVVISMEGTASNTVTIAVQ